MTDKGLDKTYDPTNIEQRWYTTWEKAGYFKAHGDNAPFCIMIPPPNVTGSLHMGHALEASIMDALIRFQRMQQRRTLWQVGTDHAGIATQMVVERQLQSQGTNRNALGRDEFIQRVWQWKKQSGDTITQQLRRMGASADWSRERFTMDEGLSNAVRQVFVTLYDEGLIYRGQRLVNWDPVLRTAVSDLEVCSQEEQGHLWHIHYPFTDGSGQLTVATTRPETLFGDMAVAVHPDDPRYQHCIGKHVQLPLADRPIPILADAFVDPAFGSGCVKITPAHDFNDYAVGERHHLQSLNIFTPDACLNDTVPKDYRGLTREAARQRVVEQLQAQNLLHRVETHQHTVPRGDRSQALIEPYLTQQWFVNIKPLAEPAIAAVENGDIRFVPDNWKNTYFSWMRDIQDWCISRQLWWGHRIPAWYDAEGAVYVGHSEEDVRQKYQIRSDVALTQDNDVLDTWFSSALWPFSTLGWPDNTPEYADFYPTSVLVTGFDIIFFWVARMIMMGLKFTGQVPFSTVYIHGLILDAKGQKMSKSKGNVLDPLDLIDGIDIETLVEKRTRDMMQPELAEKIAQQTRQHFPTGLPSFGTDALRFALCSLMTTGRHIHLDLPRIEGYRNFCNKLWNAARYALQHTDALPTTPPDETQYSVVDRWLYGELHHTIATVTQALTDYRFDQATRALYHFVWHTYCDWYLEFAKPIVNTSDHPESATTRHTMLSVLEAVLRLLHPFMPYITEELWQKVARPLGHTDASVMQQPYPVATQYRTDEQAQCDIAWLQDMITGVRTIRAEMNLSPNTSIPLLLKNKGTLDEKRLNQYHVQLQHLAKIVSIGDAGETLGMASTFLVGTLEVFVPLEGLIDKTAETQRLQKKLGKLEKTLAQAQRKIDNPNYIEKAPADIVAKERQKAEDTAQAISKLKTQLERLIG